MKIAAVAFAALSLSVLPTLAGQSGMEVYEKGRKALEKGDAVTARKCFEALLKANPNFDLAKAQLAQVVVLEKQLARIPDNLKIARGRGLESFAVDKASLEDSITFFRRRFELATAGAPVNLTGVLPEAVRERVISLSASGATFDHLLQAIGYAADVTFSYLPDGISVSTSPGAEFSAGNAKEPDMRAAAAKLKIGRLQLHEADALEAFAYLQKRAAEAGKAKPFFVIRHDCKPQRGVTLDLRNISLEEAVRAVCLVADLEETWFPWGAGIGNPRPKAADTKEAEPAATPAAPKH